MKIYPILQLLATLIILLFIFSFFSPENAESIGKSEEVSGEAIKAESTSTKADRDVYIYNSLGRRDPFFSIIELAKQKIKKKIKVRGQSPLEDYGVIDFKLLGIVFNGTTYFASILAPNGKAYTVTKGMILGQNGGKIIDIQLNKLIVKEDTFDYIGRKFSKNITLNLSEEGEE